VRRRRRGFYASQDEEEGKEGARGGGGEWGVLVGVCRGERKKNAYLLSVRIKGGEVEKKRTARATLTSIQVEGGTGLDAENGGRDSKGYMGGGGDTRLRQKTGRKER